MKAAIVLALGLVAFHNPAEKGGGGAAMLMPRSHLDGVAPGLRRKTNHVEVVVSNSGPRKVTSSSDTRMTVASFRMGDL